MAAIFYCDVVSELKKAGFIPAGIPIHVGSFYALAAGPSTVLPLPEYEEFRELLPLGIHLPVETRFDYELPMGAHPNWVELFAKAAEEIAFLRAMLAGAGLPTDDEALARFFVLHEVGHWVHYQQVGDALFLADRGRRREILEKRLPPQVYRQLLTEEWADAYALAQLKVFYARQTQQQTNQQQPQPVWRRIVSLFRRGRRLLLRSIPTSLRS
nr:hypothetical protein [Clostridia bacterium]